VGVVASQARKGTTIKPWQGPNWRNKEKGTRPKTKIQRTAAKTNERTFFSTTAKATNGKGWVEKRESSHVVGNRKPAPSSGFRRTEGKDKQKKGSLTSVFKRRENFQRLNKNRAGEGVPR